MALTDAALRSAKPRAAQYKLFDDSGLFVIVRPIGNIAPTADPRSQRISVDILRRNRREVRRGGGRSGVTQKRRLTSRPWNRTGIIWASPDLCVTRRFFGLPEPFFFAG